MVQLSYIEKLKIQHLVDSFDGINDKQIAHEIITKYNTSRVWLENELCTYIFLKSNTYEYRPSSDHYWYSRIDDRTLLQTLLWITVRSKIARGDKDVLDFIRQNKISEIVYTHSDNYIKNCNDINTAMIVWICNNKCVNLAVDIPKKMECNFCRGYITDVVNFTS